MNPHQFVCREDGQVITEELFGDQIVRFLYSEAREKAPALFQMLTGERASDLLGLLNFDLPLSATFSGSQRFLKARGVDLEESLISANEMKTPRDFFEEWIKEKEITTKQARIGHSHPTRPRGTKSMAKARTRATARD